MDKNELALELFKTSAATYNKIDLSKEEVVSTFNYIYNNLKITDETSDK